MKYIFNDDQTAFQDALRSFLAGEYDWETRRGIVGSETGWSRDLWGKFATDLGLLGLTLPSAAGGMEGSARDMLAATQALGEALIVEPYIETAILAASLLRTGGGRVADDMLQRIATGEAVVVAAVEENGRFGSWRSPETTRRDDGDHVVLTGAKSVVVGAPCASHLLVSARGHDGAAGRMALFLVDISVPGVRLDRYRTIDERQAAEVILSDVRVPASACILADDGFHDGVALALDWATVATCGEAIGVLSTIVQQTVGYMRDRRQFGKSLLEFQALQHRIADMRLLLEKAIAVTFRAAAELDDGSRLRGDAVRAAKVTVSDACRRIGQDAVQLHGGMGMSSEMPIGQLFKRAMVIEQRFGNAEHHVSRLAVRSDRKIV